MGKNDSQIKLIAVTSQAKLTFYESQGLKITKKIAEIELSVDKDHRLGKEQSHYQKKSGPSSLFEPHTSPSELEHQEAAKAIIEELEKLTSHNLYKEIIIAAEPRMLGFLRKEYTQAINKLTIREVPKDLAHHNKPELEKALFI